MNIYKTILLLGALVAAVYADADAHPKADADPGLLVTEHRHKQGVVRPGYVFKAQKHVPGYGYKTLKSYKPPVTVNHFNTRQTYYPDVVVPVTKYVHYRAPTYFKPDFYINRDYYGGKTIYDVHDNVVDDDYIYGDRDDYY